MSILLLENFLSASVRMATPLLIAALGLSISERSGLINIGVEGIMLMAAFAAYTGAKLTGSYWAGLFFGIIAALLIILIFAVTTIHYRAKQIIIGAALNILCAGASSFLYRLIFYGTGRLDGGIAARTFPSIPIPLLSSIPVIGPMLFSHNILVYFGFIMVAVLWITINKTSLGLKIIAVGDHPLAADSLGINVIKLRYGALIFSGAMIGIAGTFLSIAQASSFGENMTTGRGFIAMAVVILGKWSPVGVLGGALLFGGASALQMLVQISGVNIPRNIIMMVPYIATVLAVLAVSKRKVGAPRALGVPYEKS
jgi:general nucleoside transport system permease protein